MASLPVNTPPDHLDPDGKIKQDMLKLLKQSGRLNDVHLLHFSTASAPVGQVDAKPSKGGK